MAEPKYRDSLFRYYFIGDKRRLLSLLNALLGTDATDPNEIELNNLEASLFSAVRNDVSCVFRGQLIILVEHQSTINYNMPVRFLFYLTELLKKLNATPPRFYREKLIKFPKQRFFVVYNGEKKAPERQTLKLSDAFDGDDTVELKVQFLNINEGFNRELIERSKHLTYYCTFVERVKYDQRQGMSLKAALKEAMEYCIKNDVMADFLGEHYWEVTDMYQYEYNHEEAMAVRYQEGVEQGLEQGIKEGRELGMKLGLEQGVKQGVEQGVEQGKQYERLIMIKNLFKAGTPINFIETATGMTEEQIRAVVAQS